MKNILKLGMAAVIALGTVAATASSADAWVRYHHWGWHRPVVMGLRGPAVGYPWYPVHRGFWWYNRPWSGWRRFW